MKINFTNPINFKTGINNKSQKKQVPIDKRTSAFDEISVSHKEQNPSVVIEKIQKQVVSEVNAGKPKSDLDDIRLQIAKGTYDVNIAKITDKILFDFR